MTDGPLGMLDAVPAPETWLDYALLVWFLFGVGTFGLGFFLPMFVVFWLVDVIRRRHVD